MELTGSPSCYRQLVFGQCPGCVAPSHASVSRATCRIAAARHPTPDGPTSSGQHRWSATGTLGPDISDILVVPQSHQLSDVHDRRGVGKPVVGVHCRHAFVEERLKALLVGVADGFRL